VKVVSRLESQQGYIARLAFWVGTAQKWYISTSTMLFSSIYDSASHPILKYTIMEINKTFTKIAHTKYFLNIMSEQRKLAIKGCVWTGMT
jgi:hypothetical protein